MTERVDRSSPFVWLSAEVHAEAIRSLPTVNDVMARDVLTVTEPMSNEAALRLLRQHHAVAVPVVRGAMPVGVVSLCDLAEAGAATRYDDGYPLYYRCENAAPTSWLAPDATAHAGDVGDVMHPFVLSIEASANLVQAANRMLSENVRRLLVRKGTDLVGEVTSTDLLGGLARWFAPEVALVTPVIGGTGGGEERIMAGPEQE
jgi:CBS domain-containing protein